MINQETTEWEFQYKHCSHVTFSGVITALSERNRDAIMLNLLFSRFRRKLELSSKYGTVVFKEVLK